MKHPAALAPKGTFPTIAALPNGDALAAWEDDGSIQIQAIDYKHLDRKDPGKGTQSR